MEAAKKLSLRAAHLVELLENRLALKTFRIANWIRTNHLWSELERIVELIRWRHLQFQITENFKTMLTTKFIDCVHTLSALLGVNGRGWFGVWFVYHV